MVWGQHYCTGVATLSKLCDDLSGVQTCVWPGVSYKTNTADIFPLWHTQYTKTSIQTSCCFITAQTVHCCPYRSHSQLNSFLIPHGCNHDFACWCHTAEVLLHPARCAMSLQLLIAIGSKMLDPGSTAHDNLQNEILTPTTERTQNNTENCLSCLLHALVSICGIQHLGTVKYNHPFEMKSKWQSMELNCMTSPS